MVHLSLTFETPDNRRLTLLCGPLDANLRRIEAALGVRIRRRGPEFGIDGPAPTAREARRVLQDGYGAGGELDSPWWEDRLRDAVQTVARATPGEDADVGAGPNGGAGAASERGEAAGRPAAPSPVLRTRRSELAGRTPNQVEYLRSILQTDITFGIGPAGTGKTFLAVACAVDALERQTVQRLVLTRPAVEAGERLGFLPGDLAQKVDPYLRPLYDALYDLMGFERVTRAFEKGQIEIAPLAFMRGRTLNHAFVILDEAQNTTREQMKMFLTRMGFGSKCVVNGDISQIDLPSGVPSGLAEAERLLSTVPGVAITRFGAEDVVRHPLVARIVRAYEADDARRRREEQGDGPRDASTRAATKAATKGATPGAKAAATKAASKAASKAPARPARNPR